MSCDLLIKNGLIIDGSGTREGFVADVAIAGGKITAVGPNLGMSAAEVVDATGKIVTPGFIDIHTHYDGQITWDPLCTPSSHHGVTTVAFGNCGVGFAPCRPSDQGKLIDILESVEDIPGTALHEGIRWSWESFPEYLETLGKVNASMDFAAYMGHVPLRTYVMGDRVFDKPTPDDLEKMRSLAQEACAAGAFGVSTSRTLLHRDNVGNVLPGSYADREELQALVKGMAQGGGGMFEMASDFADAETEFTWVGRLAQAYGVPISFGFGGGMKQVKLLEEANQIAPGLITGQVAVKLQGSLQGLDAVWHPFVAHPTYLKELKNLPLPERVARMRDPKMKAQIISETSLFGDAPFARSTFSPSFLFLLGNPENGDVANYEQNPETDSIAAKAKAAGVDPMALIYDALAEGQTIWKPISPYENHHGRPDPGPQRGPRQLITHPNTVVGLGDGGAHLTMLQEAGCPTFMLTHWARDRTAGPKIPLEEAVMAQTSKPAKVMGLDDRGMVQVGLRADLNVIDFENLKLHTPSVAADLPTGAKRWLQEASGYEMTICNGLPTMRKGQPTGSLPGRLLRSPLKKHLNVTPDTDLDITTVPQPKSTADAKYIGADGSTLTVDKAEYIEDKDLVGGMSALSRAKRAHENAGSVIDIQQKLKNINANAASSKL